jgi:cellulose synthase/poly-beta-1,6-N-acetylglucosamine synthase-like glycosyltransferase
MESPHDGALSGPLVERGSGGGAQPGLRARARGEFVAFIDSDDVWYADRLSSQLPLFDRKEVGLVFIPTLAHRAR